MEVGKSEGIKIGNNPFYQPTNSGYGQPWMSSEGQHPHNIGEVPKYNEVVSNWELSDVRNDVLYLNIWNADYLIFLFVIGWSWACS